MELKQGIIQPEEQKINDQQKLDNDKWFENIMEQHRKQKNSNRIEMNPGWANPFGNASVITKDMVIQNKSKISVPKSKSNSNSKERNKSPISNKVSIQSNPSKNMIHDTEEFIFDNSKRTYLRQINGANVRKNINEFDDLL
jgi:hypothetical protein